MTGERQGSSGTEAAMRTDGGEHGVTVDVWAAWPCARRLLQWRDTAETAPGGKSTEKRMHSAGRLWGRRARKRGLPVRSAKLGRLLSAAYR